MNAWVLENVFFIVISLSGGFIFYYITGPSVEAKRRDWKQSHPCSSILFCLYGREKS